MKPQQVKMKISAAADLKLDASLSLLASEMQV